MSTSCDGPASLEPEQLLSVVAAAFVMLHCLTLPTICHLFLQDESQRMTKLGSPALAASFMGASSLGQLPVGMTPTDRLSISQSTPFSPSLAALESMPPVRAHQKHSSITCIALDLGMHPISPACIFRVKKL